MLMAAMRLNIPVVFVSGGPIGLVREGDIIRIDIPNRTIEVLVDEDEMEKRRKVQDEKGWNPVEKRPRRVSAALRAYARLATSADKGAVRDLEQL